MFLLKSRKPLAFGGWEWVIQGTGPDNEMAADKILTWFPGDTHLTWNRISMRAFPVKQAADPASQGPRQADAAVTKLLAALNAE